MVQFLTNDFVKGYPDFPTHMNALGTFVYYRTYSRFMPEKGRRETWKETVRRAVDYNVGLSYKHVKSLGYTPDVAELRQEARELFDNIFNLRQFLSGRTFWVGGAENGVADKYPLANFNCSFVNINTWDDLPDLLYALLVGTGVGFKCTPEMARNLAPIRTNTTLLHSEYNPVPKSSRYENTVLRDMQNGFAKLYVGDSKEGWTEALRLYFHVLTKPEFAHIHTVKISYNSIRPQGERLKTFGGTASGHVPLQEMFEGINKVLKNVIEDGMEPLEPVHVPTDAEYAYRATYRVRPIHILSIGNLGGAGVVVGGVRRTAQIFLMSADDWETIFAKYGINGLWSEKQFEQHEKVGQLLERLGVPIPVFFEKLSKKYHSVTVDGVSSFYATKEEADAAHPGQYVHYPANPGRKLEFRRMSNNSIAFTEKPSREMLNLVFQLMQMEGEPGFVNLEEAARRRLRGRGIYKPSREQLEQEMAVLGLNPCAEILLDGGTAENRGGGVCNLTTVNLVQFVKKNSFGHPFGKVYSLDYDALEKAQRLSARAGLRMTLVTLELPHWNRVQQRDRLLGTSLTGVKDALALVGISPAEERELLNWLGDIAREEADAYAAALRVSSPLLVTTVKPEGTLSQVAGGVSSGLHWSHSPYYIRRIRINSKDPLAKAVQALGWTVNPEVGTEGATREERMANARTYVIDFPVASGATVTKDDVSASEQLETYFDFQKYYTEHNSSNTITIRNEGEWADAENMIYERWDSFTAVSFLALDGGTYQLAPYEKISKEQYEELSSKMTAFNPDILWTYETNGESDLEGADSCEGGACPIR